MLPEPKLGFDAELAAVYLRREYQRAGPRAAGSSAPSPTRSAQHGAHGLIVWVIAGNKAARAISTTALGAELLVEQPFQWDGMDLVEAGYGWRDLPALAARVHAPMHYRTECNRTHMSQETRA